MLTPQLVATGETQAFVQADGDLHEMLAEMNAALDGSEPPGLVEATRDLVTAVHEAAAPGRVHSRVAALAAGTQPSTAAAQAAAASGVAAASSALGNLQQLLQQWAQQTGNVVTRAILAAVNWVLNKLLTALNAIGQAIKLQSWSISGPAISFTLTFDAP